MSSGSSVVPAAASSLSRICRLITHWTPAFAMNVSIVIYHVLFLLGFTLVASKFPSHAVFNADTLFLHHFAQDMLSGGNFRDWYFPIAPFVFPDAIISIPAAMLGWNNPPVYLAIYSYLQIAIGLAGIAMIASTYHRVAILSAKSRLQVATAIALYIGAAYWFSIVFFTYIQWPFWNYGYHFWLVVLPQSHSGTYAWAILCLGLYLHWRDSNHTKTNRVVLLTCLVLGCSGNTLFLVFAILPIFLSILASLGLSQKPWETDRWPGAKMALAVLCCFPIGRVLSEIIPHASLSSQSKISFKMAVVACETFGQGVLTALKAFEPLHCCSLAMGVGLMAWLISLRSKIASGKIPADLHLVIVIGSSALLTPIALIVGGNNGLTTVKNYVWTAKYLAPMLIGPFLVLAIAWLSRILSPSSTQNASVSWRPVSLACKVSYAIGFAIWGVALFGLSSYQIGTFGYKPTLIGKLVANQELNDVRHLYAGFWPARMINLFAAPKFDAQPCDHTAHPFFSLNNASKLRFAEEADETIAFLIGSDLTSGDGWIKRETVEALLGTPDRIVPVDENWTALVYKPVTTSEPCIYRIDNPNYGVQKDEVGGEFTWIGKSPASFKVNSPQPTQCKLSFAATRGPGLAKAKQARLQINTSSNETKVVTLDENNGNTEVVLKIPAGHSEIQIRSLDRPAVVTGDRIVVKGKKYPAAMMLSLSKISLQADSRDKTLDSAAIPSNRR